MKKKSLFLRSFMAACLMIGTLCSFTNQYFGLIINGDVMRVSIPADADILRVTMVGDNRMVYTFPGCGDNRCEYDVRHVAKGCYEIVIDTTRGVELEYGCK